MNCTNKFCVYCNGTKCKLKEISIGTLGICEEFIFVDIEDEILNEKKKMMIKRWKDEKKSQEC